MHHMRVRVILPSVHAKRGSGLRVVLVHWSEDASFVKQTLCSFGLTKKCAMRGVSVISLPIWTI